MKITYNWKFLNKIAANKIHQPIKRITLWPTMVYYKKVLFDISKSDRIIPYINGSIYYHLYRWRKCILLNATCIFTQSQSKLDISWNLSTLTVNVIYNVETYKTFLWWQETVMLKTNITTNYTGNKLLILEWRKKTQSLFAVMIIC